MSPVSDPPWVLNHAPYTPWMHRRTAGPPGISPLDMAEWTVRDQDFDAQMAYRRQILARDPEAVLASTTAGEEAGLELLSMVLSHLGDVASDGSPRALTLKEMFCPFTALNNLVAEDWCLMQHDPEMGEYKLVAAILCFPARWKLSEKMNRAMIRIHKPVKEYDDLMARRVGRLFDVLDEARPLVRINWLVNTTPELFLPLGEEEKEIGNMPPASGFYVRTERQTLVRLPRTRAVAFGIKTSVTPIDCLTAEQAAGMHAAMLAKDSEVLEYRVGDDKHSETLRRLEAIAAE
ncbi:MAG: DUF3445 domain-containing protein [Pseudomonadota bacterium]